MIINDTKQEDQQDEYLSDDSDDNRDTKYNILDVDENGIEEEEECAEFDNCNQLDSSDELPLIRDHDRSKYKNIIGDELLEEAWNNKPGKYRRFRKFK